MAGHGSDAFDGRLLALRMHRSNLDRATHFQTLAVSSPGWDAMLTVYIAHGEGLDVPFASLCAANRLSAEAGAEAVRALEGAGLVRWKDGEGSDARRVEITPRGAAQMNQFLQRVALSA
ncbi:MAG: hypothetical protein DI547_14700 [Sphingobium sp.]|jgi:hypothetical protein|nr:MAG: hypothetical protein DI547_14700 [Sphingobium sp.]